MAGDGEWRGFGVELSRKHRRGCTHAGGAVSGQQTNDGGKPRGRHMPVAADNRGEEKEEGGTYLVWWLCTQHAHETGATVQKG